MPIFYCNQWRNTRATLTFIIPTLLNFIEVKYQERSDSPFETHPITMFFSIFSLLLHCSLSLPLVAHLPAFHTTHGARIFRFMMILSFFLSISLPTSLLFPRLSFFLLYLLLLMLLSIAYFCSLIQKLIHLIWQKIVVFLNLFAHRLHGGRALLLPPHRVADMHFVLELWYLPKFNKSSLEAQEEIKEIVVG
ncbi:hypothetical protein ACJRO7_028140 [Eucalyptus globulus]|uniref:Uncharacterized protein n=1 Tax=Eucalyptus globulus TaxID=34317 RepID=A0ABD3JUS6_EUCGL